MPAFTAEQKTNIDQVITTTPLEIKIKILSTDDFLAQRKGQGTIAWTEINRNPCTIILPENWKIFLNLPLGIASWQNSWQNEVLAHEIAHCFAGAWHPEVSIVIDNRRRAAQRGVESTPSNE